MRKQEFADRWNLGQRTYRGWRIRRCKSINKQGKCYWLDSRQNRQPCQASDQRQAESMDEALKKA